MQYYFVLKNFFFHNFYFHQDWIIKSQRILLDMFWIETSINYFEILKQLSMLIPDSFLVLLARLERETKSRES